MRIALSYPGCHRRGGVERVIYECAGYLAGRQHEVTVFASDWESNDFPIRYQRVTHRQWPPFIRPHCFFRECTSRLNGGDFDVHASFGSECPTGGVFWAQSVHRAWLDRVKRFRAPMSLGRWKQRLNPLHPMLLHLEREHFAKRNYRKIIALTPEVQGDLQQFYSVPAEDVVVIPNGFAPAEFNVARCAAQRDEMRRTLGYGEEDKVVIFVANETERKGFTPLLRAVESLNDSSIKILAVGRLDANASNGSKQVQFVGPTSDAARYYAAADVFALPTQYEAWGLVIVEALACGLPVVTSRLAGAAVAVREGVTGELLDEPRDESEIAGKLMKVLNRAGPDAKVIAASVEQYSWSRVLKRYEQVLVECATG